MVGDGDSAQPQQYYTLEFLWDLVPHRYSYSCFS